MSASSKGFNRPEKLHRQHQQDPEETFDERYEKVEHDHRDHGQPRGKAP